MNLYILSIRSFTKTRLSQMMSLIKPQLQHRISPSQALPIQWQKAHSTLLIQTALTHELPQTPIALKYNRYGKPQLANLSRHFNLSHSKNYVLLATSRHPLGVDIEHIEHFKEIDTIAHEFPLNDQKEYFRKKENERTSFFYDLWTKYESYHKALGKKLAFTPIPSPWNFYHFNIANYQCAICSRHKFIMQNIHLFTTNTLLEQ